MVWLSVRINPWKQKVGGWQACVGGGMNLFAEGVDERATNIFCVSVSAFETER